MTGAALPSTGAQAMLWLEALAPSGVRLGLDRVHAALRAVKSPERDYPAVHVAGTNGKGSTCAFIAACLSAQGYRVGLYTSPHLVRVNERFKVNGQDISDALLGQRLLEVLELYPEAAADPPPLTYFEAGTVAALWHFSREQVDVAVLETGLGGRLDATAAARPLVTAVTPVSFDHMDYLGHTLSAIAGEKAGIFKAGVPAVSARQPPEVLAVLERVAREVGAPFFLEGRDFLLVPEAGEGAKTFHYRGLKSALPKLWPGLPGGHQVQNAAVALACLELLGDRGLPVAPAHAREGLAGAEWPGRLETLDGRPPVVLDGAHNPAAVETLVAALATLYPGRRVHLVFGVLADKDRRPMLRTLLPVCASAHLSPLPSMRSLAPDRYLAEARELCPKAFACASVREALDGAVAAAGAGDLVLCAGSLFLVGQVKRLVEEGWKRAPGPLD